MASRRRLIIAGLLLSSWLVITLAGTVPAAVLTSMGDLFCEADAGDSNYGRMKWSWAPPGPRCVWTTELNGFAASDRPSPIWSVWLATSAALWVVAVWQLIAAVRSLDAASAPSSTQPPSPRVMPRPPGPARPPYET
jgi:hypothetical protein